MTTTLLLPMLRLLLIFALFFVAALSLRAADPSEQFLSAYQSYQQAEDLERQGNTADAITKYRFAESLLLEISKNDPSWQKPVIEYRLKKTRDSLDRLQGGASDSGGGLQLAPPANQVTPTDTPTPSSTPDQNRSGPSITIVPPSGISKNQSQESSDSNSSSETKRLRRQVEELQGELQESRDAFDAQKRRASDLENTEWVKKRSELLNELDMAKRRISDLEHDLKSHESWGKDLTDLQKKLDDTVADKLVIEEQFEKTSDEKQSLMKQLEEAKSKVVSSAESNKKIEQLTKDAETSKEAYLQLQAKLEHSDQEAKASLAKNEDLQKQLESTSEKLTVAQKQVEKTAPLLEKIKMLQSKEDQAAAAIKHESTLEADNEVLQEEHDRLIEKVTLLGAAAKEASQVGGLKLESEALKKNVAELNQRLEAGDKELEKARALSEAAAKAEAEALKIQNQKVADAEADRAVLEEEKGHLTDKLNQQALTLKELKTKSDALPSLQEEVEKLKTQLAENTEALAQSSAKLAQEEKDNAATRDQAQQKDQASRNLADLLTQQNSALQEQLKTALGQISAAVNHTSEAAALKEQITKLQEQMDLNANNYAASRHQFLDLGKSQPDQEKALQEKEAALAAAKEEAIKLRSQLADTSQQLSILKKQGDEGASRLKELQDQLAERDAKIARYKKKKGNIADEQVVEENTLLRGIVLRQIKEEAKKAQAGRLMGEELKRLNVQSDSLQQEMNQLAAPALQLTDQERALFKDSQLVVSEEDDSSLHASVSAPATPPAATVSTNAAAGQTETNTAASPQLQEQFKALLEQAKEEFDRQDYLQAENTFQEALKISPNNYFALSNLGVVEFQLGKMNEAEASLKKASEQSDASSFALTTLGIVHYRQGRLPDAEQVLRHSVAINDQDFTAHNYLGIVLAASGKGKAGESEIMRAIEINPKYADAHFNLAVIYATGKPPAKMMAKQHYNKALELGSPPDASLEHLIQ